MKSAVTTDLITVTGLELVLTGAADEARAQRDELLVQARAGKSVTSPASATRAGEIYKELMAYLRSIEDARKAAKKPIDDKAAEIQTLARELTSAVQLEADRISKLLGAWQSEQTRLAEEARKKAWEAEQEIIRAAQEKARKDAAAAAAEAEALRLKADRARSDEKAAEWKAKADAAALAAQKADEAHHAQVEQAIVETRVAAAAIIPTKPEGLATRTDPKFEITDIVKLYEAAPFLVTLSPNNAAIKSAIKGLTNGQSLPGVRHWFEAKTIVR